MSMTFNADASGTFGTIEINGVGIFEIHSDGTLKDPTGNVVATSEGIVGTVSQSGGVPTGAIIETGSNANGEYTKYADGTLICTGSSGTVTAASYYIGSSLYWTWTFPATFTSTPIVISTSQRASDSIESYTRIGVTSTTQADVSQSNSSGSTIKFIMIAIGRWY